MASKMKKLFHRRKDGDEPTSPDQHRSYAGQNDPSLRASPYESTAPAGQPHTGDYPIRSSDNAAVPARQRSWRSFSSRGVSSRTPPPDPYVGQSPHAPDMPSVRGHPPGGHEGDVLGQEKNSTTTDVNQPRLPPVNMSEDFANMNLTGQGPYTTTTHGPNTVTTTTTSSFGSGPNGPRAAPPTQSSTTPKKSTLRSVNPSDVQQAYTRNAPSTQAQSREFQQDDYARQRRHPESSLRDVDGSIPHNNSMSIPRKEVRTAAAGPPGQAVRTSIEQSQDSRYYSSVNERRFPDQPHSNAGDVYGKDRKAPSLATPSAGSGRDGSTLPSHSYSDERDGYGGIRTPQPQANASAGAPQDSSAVPSDSSYHARNLRSSTNHGPSEPGTTRANRNHAAMHPSAQTVVDRAKSNTYDTSVVEKVAPAVVHETIHKDIHHIREELITRDIHEHDVYHRVLPVVDVEVLPPRHFLPVEGGGLVEIGASEVPGRGNNWVIAETASKIASDQAPPTESRRFSARAFPGRQGDASSYITPEGHEKTEDTWVHAPELETGARDTGQSWPMEMGVKNAEKNSHRASREQKKRSSKRHSHRANGTEGRHV